MNIDDDVDKAQAILEGRCKECGWKNAHTMTCSENICRTPKQLDLFTDYVYTSYLEMLNTPKV